MFSAVNWVLRAFLLGLAVGLLVAPRQGAETRRLVRGMFVGLLDPLAELLALPSEPVELRQPVTDGERAGASRP